MSVPERYKGPWEKTYWAFVGGRRGSLVFFVFTTRQKERSQKHSDVGEELAPRSIKVMSRKQRGRTKGSGIFSDCSVWKPVLIPYFAPISFLRPCPAMLFLIQTWRAAWVSLLAHVRTLQQSYLEHDGPPFLLRLLCRIRHAVDL